MLFVFTAYLKLTSKLVIALCMYEISYRIRPDILFRLVCASWNDPERPFTQGHRHWHYL